MTNVVLTSNLRLANEFRACGVPEDQSFVPIEIDGVRYHYRFVLNPRVYDCDDFARNYSEHYFTLGHDGERVPADGSRRWREIIDGEIAGTYAYQINPDD